MSFVTELNMATESLQDWFSPHVETLLEKGSGRVNEDVLLEKGNLFGVFDGATSLTDDDLPEGLSGGLLAARISAESFRHNGNNRSLASCAELANRRINDMLRRRGICLDERHRLWSASAAVVRLEDGYFDYCQTGDSLIFCLYQDGTYRQLTPAIDHDQDTLIRWKNISPSPEITIRDVLFDQILAVRLQMNVCYGVLNGEPEAMGFLKCGREKMDGVSSLLLFTDGLFIPKEDPEEENDWDTLINLYSRGGLGMVRDFVRSLQRQDPECRTYPRFKIHDDIAAIAVKLNG